MTSSPPVAKRSILKWIGFAFLLLFGWFLWSLFGPNPPIIISKQTTYITAPLAADGLPDYEAYLLEEMRKHKPKREDNAAVAMWQTMGPGDMDPADWKLLEAELGSLAPPEGVKRIEDPYDKKRLEAIVEWLAEQGSPVRNCDAASIVDAALERPWTASQFPPLAEWVRENDSALNLLIEGSKRKGFYSPSPSYLDGKKGKLNSASMPHVRSVRVAAQALNLRANLRLGEQNVVAALGDVIGVISYAKRVKPPVDPVEATVGLSLLFREAVFACQLMPQATEAELHSLRSSLDGIEPKNWVSDSINTAARLGVLDMVVNGTLSDLAREFEMEDDDTGDFALELGRRIRTDRNIILKTVNEHFDQLHSAFESDICSKSQSQLEICEATAEALIDNGSKRIRNVGRVAFSINERSEITASQYLNWLLPPSDRALSNEHIALATLQLLRTAIEIELFRSNHGVYPDKLFDVRHEVVQDHYHGHPFIYRRTENGFLLYSRGANGKDEGGSCDDLLRIYKVYEGTPIRDTSDPRHEQIPDGADDISLRIPVEYPPWPWERKAEEE